MTVPPLKLPPSREFGVLPVYQSNIVRYDTAALTVATVNCIIEGVLVAAECKLVVVGWDLLQALDGHSRKISGVSGVVSQHHSASRHKAINEWHLGR